MYAQVMLGNEDFGNEDFGPGLACGLRSQVLAKVSLERELQLESAGVYRCE